MFRRLFSSSSRVATALEAVPPKVLEAVAAPRRIKSVDVALLPGALQRIIRKEVGNAVDAGAGGATVSIRNPFILHTYTEEVKASPNRLDLAGQHRTRVVRIPPVIPVRKQKQLLTMYPATHLPPSPTNPVPNARAVKLEDGTLVEYSGDWAKKKSRGLYGHRRRMFKGTMAEREHDLKIREREERMATMDKRVADWKKAKAETQSTKSSLPF